MPPKLSRRRRYIEAAGLAIAAALGVVQVLPKGTEWWRAICAMLAAGLPVFFAYWRHTPKPVPVAAAVPGAKE